MSKPPDALGRPTGSARSRWLLPTLDASDGGRVTLAVKPWQLAAIASPIVQDNGAARRLN